MSKRRRFKDKVKTLIENDAYHMVDVWAALKSEDRQRLLIWVQQHSQYRNAHMGVLGLMSVKRIFEIIALREEYNPGLRNEIKNIDRVRGLIKRKIKRDIRREEYLAHLRAKERHTA